MGKKTRKKRVHRFARVTADSDFLLRNMRVDQENQFHRHIEATRALLCQYKRVDAAIALSVSDLCPVNAGSPIKHIFARSPTMFGTISTLRFFLLPIKHRISTFGFPWMANFPACPRHDQGRTEI